MFRKERMESLIHREIADFLERNLDKDTNVLVSITGVRINNALDKAEILVSVYPEDKASFVFKNVKRMASEAHKFMAGKLKSKKNPMIIFLLDKSQTKSIRLEKLLENVENE